MYVHICIYTKYIADFILIVSDALYLVITT